MRIKPTKTNRGFRTTKRRGVKRRKAAAVNSPARVPAVPPVPARSILKTASRVDEWDQGIGDYPTPTDTTTNTVQNSPKPPARPQLGRIMYGNLNPDAVKVASDLIALASHRSEIEKISDPVLRQRVYQALAMAPTNGSIPNDAPKGHTIAKMMVVYSLNQLASAAERGDFRFFYAVGQSIEQGFGRKSPVDHLRFVLAARVYAGKSTKGISRAELTAECGGDERTVVRAAKKMGFTFRPPGRPRKP